MSTLRLIYPETLFQTQSIHFGRLFGSKRVSIFEHAEFLWWQSISRTENMVKQNRQNPLYVGFHDQESLPPHFTPLDFIQNCQRASAVASDSTRRAKRLNLVINPSSPHWDQLCLYGYPVQKVIGGWFKTRRVLWVSRWTSKDRCNPLPRGEWIRLCGILSRRHGLIVKANFFCSAFGAGRNEVTGEANHFNVFLLDAPLLACCNVRIRVPVVDSTRLSCTEEAGYHAPCLIRQLRHRECVEVKR